MNDIAIAAGPRGFVDSGGEQIYFESYGDGETIVLTHGMGGNHVVWYQQVAALAADHRVITWDQRGFGRSTSGTGNVGPGPAVDDLTRILDHLDISRAHIVGQSMGGWAALGFALDHPDRTLSLALADTIGGIYTPAIRQSFDDYGKLMASGPRPDEMPLGRHPAVGQQLADEDLAKSFLYSQIGGSGPQVDPGTIFSMLLATDNTHRLDALRTPTLFIVGEHDPIFSPTVIDEAASLVANREVVVIPDTGHSPYFESPERWNDALSKFLQRSG